MDHILLIVAPRPPLLVVVFWLSSGQAPGHHLHSTSCSSLTGGRRAAEFTTLGAVNALANKYTTTLRGRPRSKKKKQPRTTASRNARSSRTSHIKLRRIRKVTSSLHFQPAFRTATNGGPWSTRQWTKTIAMISMSVSTDGMRSSAPSRRLAHTKHP